MRQPVSVVGALVSQDTTRRDVVKKIAIVVGGAVTLIALPSQWTKPVVQSIVAPAHAALSVAAATTAAPTTAAPTTAAPTTTPGTTSPPTTSPP